MSRLYPNLHEQMKSEKICPICLKEMAYIARFSCENDHVICERCRPYFFNCPQCLQPLRKVPEPRPRQFASQSQYVPQMTEPYPSPSAPSLQEFQDHERNIHSDVRLFPTHQPELFDCPYARLGCTAKFVEALRYPHVSRCRYNKHRGDEFLEQTIEYDSAESPCRYQSVGCNVQMSRERLASHEEKCIYKDREPSPPRDESGERVPCRYKSHGCNVRMSHWRLANHEDICIYKDREPSPPPSDEGDDRVPCRYQSVGCNVRMPHWRLASHEEMCIYKEREPSPPKDEGDERVPCRYQSVGCNVRMPHWRLPSHEPLCIYKERASGEFISTEDLSRYMHSSCRLEENPNQLVGCRYQAWGCNAKLPLWRKQVHESQCQFRRH